MQRIQWINNQTKDRLISLSILLLIILLPLPKHWVLLRQDFPSIYYEYSSLSLYLPDVILLFMLGLTAVSVKPVWTVSAKSAPHSKQLLLTLLRLLLLLTNASTLWALDPVLAMQHALRLWLLYLLVCTLLSAKLNQQMIQWGIGFTLISQSAIALTQFIRQDDLGWRWLGEVDLNRYPGGGSILTVMDGISGKATYWLRGYGLTPHPNILGGVLALFLLTAVIIFLQAKSSHKPAWLLILLLGVAGLLVTFSRSAWLGFAVGGLFLAGAIFSVEKWRRVYGRYLLIAGFAMFITGGGMLWQLRDLILVRTNVNSSSTESRSVNERQALIEISSTLYQLAPLTGIGAANFGVAAIPLAANLDGVAPQPVHHLPRLLAAELGIGGAILWLGLMIVPVITAVNLSRYGQLSLWTVGLTAALLAFALIDLFDYYAWGWTQGQLLRWLYWGVWLAAVQADSAIRADYAMSPTKIAISSAPKQTVVQ